MAWLEREACFVRRGTNKAENRETWGEAWGTRRMVARGFVGTAYRHRTSRAGDPHLHWHVLVANLAQGIDGRWSALDGRAIYDTARTGGAVFQAAMRRELTAALGLEWGPVHDDAAEIAGIPHTVLREFSQRREQIAEWLDDAGEAGPAAAAAVQRATRTRKQVPVDFTAVEADWHTRAEAVGWGPAELELLLASAVPSAVRGGFVIQDESWRNGVRSVTTRLVGFDDWLHERPPTALHKCPGQDDFCSSWWTPVDAVAEVDGNRTRRTGIARPNRFEGGGAHQVPGHLHLQT